MGDRTVVMILDIGELINNLKNKLPVVIKVLVVDDSAFMRKSISVRNYNGGNGQRWVG